MTVERDSDVGFYFMYRVACLTQASPIPAKCLLMQAENKTSVSHKPNKMMMMMMMMMMEEAQESST